MKERKGKKSNKLAIQGLTTPAVCQILESFESQDGNIRCNLHPSKVGKPICNSLWIHAVYSIQDTLSVHSEEILDQKQSLAQKREKNSFHQMFSCSFDKPGKTMDSY